MCAYLSGINSIQQNLEGLDNVSSIVSYLDTIPKLPKHIFINETTLFYRDNLNEVINRLKKRYQFHIISIDPIKLVFSSSESKNEPEFETLVLIIPGSQPETMRAIAVAKPAIWEKIVAKFSKSMYPYLMPIYYKQMELEKAFNNLQIFLGNDYQIRILDLTLKESRGLTNEPHISKQDTKRWWTNISILDVFNLAKEQSLLFTSLKYSIDYQKPTNSGYKKSISGRISKFGRITFDYSYSTINKGLVDFLESAAIRRLRLFENRSLKDQKTAQSRPIQISYPYDIFANTEEIRKTGDIFSKYPNASRIEYHCNPYYHSSIADFLDGSSFDIWITSLRKIIIIPQLKATVQAFERLTTFVFSNFGEGIVDDFAID